MPASVYICQGGCGTFEEDVSKLFARGIVHEKLYCAKCVASVDSYLEMRDALHDDLAKQWAEGMFTLESEFKKSVKVLPDGG